MDKQIDVVAAVIYKEDGQILCFQRGPGRNLAGLWEFPGGKIESGETEKQALVREIAEELKAELIIDNYIGHASYVYDFGTVNMSLYSGSIKNNYYELTEHLQAVWLDRKDLMSLEWAPVDLPFINKIMEM